MALYIGTQNKVNADPIKHFNKKLKSQEILTFYLKYLMD